MKKLSKVLIVGTLCLSLCGCGKVATLANGEDAIVTATDTEGISANQLYDALKEKYGTDILVDMIDRLILSNKYKTDDAENSYVNEQVESLKTSATSNKVTFEYLLNYYGFEDEKAVREYLSLSYKRDQAVKEYVSNNLSEKEIKEYYDSNIFGDLNAKHILIAPNTTDSMSDSEKETADKEAYNKAKEVIEKLNNGGSWDDLAKEYSTDDSNKDKGGDLGWFSHGDMVSEFEDATRSLDKDTYSKEPVKTKYGYHIIYKVDEKDKPSLDDSKDSIKDTLAENKINADSTLYYSTLDNIRKDAGVNIEDDTLNKGYKSYLTKNTTASTTSSN